MSKYLTTPKQWIEAPPMGWNSWDCYGASVTEDEVLQNAVFVEAHLLKFGWNTIVVDIQWSEPTADGWLYHAYAPLCLDEYGRQLPAENRFPSAADGQGFAPLASKVHDMGMKFGVHLLRGIPRQAVHTNVPILGTEYTAREIVDTTSICRWNTDMYGLNPDHPGAQAYYDSVIQLFADWGVDYIKVDDIAWNYVADQHYPRGEVEMLHRAIGKSGRPMFLSLSPGPADPRHRTHFHQFANSWRVTDDFWDTWPLLARCIDACIAWTGDSGEGSWPDADMLPFGRILMRQKDKDGHWGKDSDFTADEVQLVFALWCIMRSPLMIGADLPSSADGLTEVLNQAGYLEWSQYGSAARLLTSPDDSLLAWTQSKPLPETPSAFAGLISGPATEHLRFPLLLVNRSEAVIEVNLDEWLQAHWYPGHVQSGYEVQDNAHWQPTLGTISVPSHGSKGFVLSVSRD